MKMARMTDKAFSKMAASGKVLLAVLLLPFFLSSPAEAYMWRVHEAVVREAARELCQTSPDSRSCLEFSQYLDFAVFGSRMEDAFVQGGSYVFQGRVFNDEDGPEAYCSVRGTVGGRPYCTHYWFDSGGAAGSNMFGATNSDPDAVIGLVQPTRRWDSLWDRAVKLWNGKVLPYYAKGDYPQAYYWLGRTAHLLADAGVPQHVIPHPAIGMTELKHRCYELRAELKYPVFLASRLEPAPAPESDPYSIFIAMRSASREAAGYRPSAKEAREGLTPEKLKLFDELAAVLQEEKGEKTFSHPLLDRSCGAIFGDSLDREASVLLPQIAARTAAFIGYFYSRGPFLPPELPGGGAAQADGRPGGGVPER